MTFLALSESGICDDPYYGKVKHLATNITVDLMKGGIMEGRFVLTVSNLISGIPDMFIPDKAFSVYSSSGIINIISLANEFNNIAGSVNIYDLTG